MSHFENIQFLEGNQLDISLQVLVTSFLRCHVALKAFSISSHGLPSFKKFGQQLQLLERNPSGTPSLILVKSFLRGQVALANLRISSCGQATIIKFHQLVHFLKKSSQLNLETKYISWEESIEPCSTFDDDVIAMLSCNFGKSLYLQFLMNCNQQIWSVYTTLEGSRKFVNTSIRYLSVFSPNAGKH